ncbi:dicarboxylate/amino acid:cation symporter [Christiangramia sp. OXR-203]|jgi:Na+/H+-dicarboxylate symporter|uniref:dicarboxylate/amino acid:cation symporter n=1 Tax=unclassified Christiangramia TaxID=2615027 RepID=UPI002AC987CE|nr:dicarboxylate/amino acid:cation symporter [Christiangramia sp. OXR-203]WPY97124.1 dicarboxylate/amino acid:cation symporter [Christiangramia sp. OXR-203]
MKKLALHWQILLGMAVGVIFGLIMTNFSWGPDFTEDWIKPFGNIFINALKLIAVPLILASLIKGISDLKDISKLSKMGTRTIATYIVTTVIAVSIGLLMVNLIAPGKAISEETRSDLIASYEGDASVRITDAQKQKDAGPLQALEDLVPSNIFGAASDNGNMLQVIFFAIFFGLGLILIPEKTAKPVKDFFDGFNEVILKMIDLIMLTAPYGVFALLAALVVESPSADLFAALAMYALTVLLGLALMIGVYILLVWIFTKNTPSFFLNGIGPAQLLAFSTSSSAATLPVTMERVEEHMGVNKEVTSFVLPIGATINMDGTSLYQAVAAVFIAQAFGMDLTLGAQLGIIATATLASIGSAAVPGAGMVMLVIVLAQAGIPEAGLALIFAVDRPLDMCRTTVNVTGDAAVSLMVAKSVDMMGPPNVKDWDDDYHPENEETV